MKILTINENVLIVYSKINCHSLKNVIVILF